MSFELARAGLREYAAVALRVALAAAFLYSVADRCGWLGPAGTPNVSWGAFARFTAYVGMLNWFLPHAAIPALAWIDTALEAILALALLAGLWLRCVSIISGLLLLTFGTAMAIAGGIGAPLQYSVFTAAFAALLLAGAARSRWSLDTLLARSSRTR